MNRTFQIFAIIIILLLPVISIADHDCNDGRDAGLKIPVKKELPIKWLTIGKRLINDAELHNILRTKYAKYYTSGKESENFIVDRFCGFQEGVYVLIHNGDFGPSAEFSKVPPTCFTCKQIEEPIPLLISGTGLKSWSKQKNSNCYILFRNPYYSCSRR